LAAHSGALPALQALVVANRLELLVVEVLHRLVIEQAVDSSSIGLGIKLVHLPAEARAPFGDGHGVENVGTKRNHRDADEPQVVARDQDRRNQPDLDQRRKDRKKREADQRRNPSRTALDIAGEAARMAGKMKTQRQRVQVAKGLQRDRAHRALGDLGEQVFTQLGERGGRQAQNSIGKEQRNRQDQHLSRGRKRQAVDDALEYQRHADV